MAAAVGTPSIGMYGVTRPEDCGPYGPHTIALQEYYQDGTSRQRRAANNDAMRAITVERVAEVCDELLGRTATMPEAA